MPLHAVRELDHLAGLDLVEAVDAGDAVADRQHLADFGDIGLAAEIGDLLLQDGGNFRRANFHQNPLRFLPSSCPDLIRASTSRVDRWFAGTSPAMTVCGHIVFA